VLEGTANTGVRRRDVLRRAASGLLAVVVGLAAGAVVGLGVVTTDSPSTGVTRAVLGDSRASLVGPDATPVPPSSERLVAPSPASVVALAAAGRLARPALTAGDIPPAAWDAYLRAAAVLAKAAPRCELDWTVLAAIGLVESDHGRDLHGSGRSAGPRRAAPDTDGGRLDGDPRRDVPVGPMQLLPSTWQVIGVDGDGDGVRSPADPDDAALAVGVALCAGDARLGTTAGLREALLRFAPSPAYVRLVIGIARAYAETRADVPAARLTVTAIAHPVVQGTRTTLARHALARRVEAAQAAAAKSVGVGTSKSAQLLAAAMGSAAPTTAPAATGSPGAGALETGAAPSATTGPSPSGTGASEQPSGSGSGGDASPSGDPSSGGSASEDPSGTPATDPSPSDPSPSGTPATDPPASGTPDPSTDVCPSPAPDPSGAPVTDPGTDPTPTDPSASPDPCPDPTADPSATADVPSDSPAPAGSATTLDAPAGTLDPQAAP
jgi:hypothetical protein